MKHSGLIRAAAGVMALLATGSALRAQSISMSYVTVGNPNNAADPNTGSHYGSVSFTYDIGEYDVTDAQYCTFLNDVDPTGANALAVYSPQGDTEYGISFNSGAASGSKYTVTDGYANMPVVDVTYWDTLRFVNWMNNGEGNASTETGAYTLLGGNANGNGSPSNASSLLSNPQPNAGATVFLPNENEWYKAAYYDPATGFYSLYGAGPLPAGAMGIPVPGNIIGNGTDEANYEYYDGSQYIYSLTQSPNYTGQNYLTAVGSYTDSASHYGTFDQAGDVNNWVSTTISSNDFVFRGGAWDDTAPYLSSSERRPGFPYYASNDLGFRVASIPEPNSTLQILAGMTGVAFMRGKRFKL